jgi:hypothetical protein
MGADIYLQSIWKPFDEKLSQTPPPQPSAFENVEAFSAAFFEEARASGGYFRNGYNAGDLMWALGLSWHDTVSPMLDQGYLPIARARELIAMIEARPLTRERVAAHIFEHMTNGIDEHPVNGYLQRMMAEVAAEVRGELPPKLSPPDLDHLLGFLHKRREELLTILRKSIELDEPLYCEL